MRNRTATIIRGQLGCVVNTADGPVQRVTRSQRAYTNVPLCDTVGKTVQAIGAISNTDGQTIGAVFFFSDGTKFENI
jgi:hypothetical protein